MSRSLNVYKFMLCGWGILHSKYGYYSYNILFDWYSISDFSRNMIIISLFGFRQGAPLKELDSSRKHPVHRAWSTYIKLLIIHSVCARKFISFKGSFVVAQNSAKQQNYLLVRTNPGMIVILLIVFSSCKARYSASVCSLPAL